MSRFKCNSCKAVYEDHYPPDDICLKCGKAAIRIIPPVSKQNNSPGYRQKSIKDIRWIPVKRNKISLYIRSFIMRMAVNKGLLISSLYLWIRCKFLH